MTEAQTQTDTVTGGETEAQTPRWYHSCSVWWPLQEWQCHKSQEILPWGPTPDVLLQMGKLRQGPRPKLGSHSECHSWDIWLTD